MNLPERKAMLNGCATEPSGPQQAPWLNHEGPPFFPSGDSLTVAYRKHEFWGGQGARHQKASQYNKLMVDSHALSPRTLKSIVESG